MASESLVLKQFAHSVRSRSQGAASKEIPSSELDAAVLRVRQDVEQRARDAQTQVPGLSWDDAVLSAINANPRAVDDAVGQVLQFVEPVQQIAEAAVSDVAPLAAGPSVGPIKKLATGPWQGWATLGIAMIALVVAVVAMVVAFSGADPLGDEPTNGVPSTLDDSNIPPTETPAYEVDEDPVARVGADRHELKLQQEAVLDWQMAPTVGCASIKVLDDTWRVAFERTNVCLSDGAEWTLSAGTWSVVYDYAGFTGNVQARLH